MRRTERRMARRQRGGWVGGTASSAGGRRRRRRRRLAAREWTAGASAHREPARWAQRVIRRRRPALAWRRAEDAREGERQRGQQSKLSECGNVRKIRPQWPRGSQTNKRTETRVFHDELRSLAHPCGRPGPFSNTQTHMGEYCWVCGGALLSHTLRSI
jgi:hypothetical protein